MSQFPHITCTFREAKPRRTKRVPKSLAELRAELYELIMWEVECRKFEEDADGLQRMIELSRDVKTWRLTKDVDVE